MTAIVDYAARKGDLVLFGEVKDGMESKLSPNQKSVFKEMLAKGEVAIVNAEKAAILELQAGRALGQQLSLSTRIAITLDAAIGSRASGSWARTLAVRGLVGAATIFLAPAALGAELLLHSSEAR